MTAGALDRNEGSPVHWTLAADPRIYQAELLLDYGTDGIALDVLMLEVGRTEGVAVRTGLHPVSHQATRPS